jgi:hypothetical protein
MVGGGEKWKAQSLALDRGRVGMGRRRSGSVDLWALYEKKLDLPQQPYYPAVSQSAVKMPFCVSARDRIGGAEYLAE